MRTILFFLYRSRCNFVFCTAVLLSVVLTVAGALSASTTPQIACGGNHTISLKSDGTVWAWGRNGDGQLGYGTDTYSKTPVQVKTDSKGNDFGDVTAIAGGFFHTIALKKDGTVWAWGDSRGQLTTDSKTPVQVSGLSGVTAIAGGGYHSLALKSDGTVWAWGYNGGGQLGDGTKTDSNTPVQVSSLSGVTAIAGGGFHSLVACNINY